MLYQVDEGLRLMQAEGAEAVFARHEACARAAREGLAALGFELLAESRVASPTVTAARIPAGLDWKAVNSEVRRRGVVLAGGQGELSGQIFRLGHLGFVSVADVEAAVATLGEVLEEIARVRILVAEALAEAGVERLRGAHDVDVRVSLSRADLLAAIPDYDALVVRSQIAVDAGADRRREPAHGRRARRRRRRQRRPRGCDAGGDHRRQRADRQHDRGRRAHARVAVRVGTSDRSGRCIDATG